MSLWSNSDTTVFNKDGFIVSSDKKCSYLIHSCLFVFWHIYFIIFLIIIIEIGPQGCVLSPLLFNIYAEAIFSEALDEASGGIRINGIPINNLRYADDTVILANNQGELQQMMDRVVQHSEAMGLTLNTKKTKCMVFSKHPENIVIKVKNEIIEQVPSFRYLGTVITDSCDIKREIHGRIEQARRAFLNMKNFFTRPELSLALRMRMIRCYVFSTLLYGCESWTLDPTTENRIAAFEMYLYRRILRIPWVQKVTNNEVLVRMKKDRELLFTLKKRKLTYLGHVLRGEKYEILRVILEGKIVGKRSVGRRQNSWTKDLRRWCACSTIELFRKAASKIQTALWIANFLQGNGV